MDNQTLMWIISACTAAGFSVLGWLARKLWDAVDKLKEELSKFELKVAEDYVRHDRLQDAFKPIMDALSEIKETLKTKADK